MNQHQAEPLSLRETIPEALLAKWRRGPLFLMRNAPEVELYGDVLTLHWGTHEIRARIQECHFRIGRAWEMKRNCRKAKPIFPFGSNDLILIDFPPLYNGPLGGVRSYYTAPVGFTEETLRQWSDALGDVLG